MSLSSSNGAAAGPPAPYQTTTSQTGQETLSAQAANDVAHQWLVNALPGYKEQLIVSTANLLAQHGYESMESLMWNKTSRAEWSEFAGRIGVPDAVATHLAKWWGPKLPDANMVMDRRERLDAELRAHYGGDWDNAMVYQSKPNKPINFLAHDTWLTTVEDICREGLIRAQAANDAAYDGHLVFGQAPPVVFFQATSDGTDKSIYPRESQGHWSEQREKGRFLILPRQLALHTKAFRMYFVQISEPRQNKAHGYSNGNVILQLHLLFVSENHKSIDFCEQNFLLVNKKTFQPFRYDASEQKWKSFDKPSESEAGKSDYPFLGRKVMVNVAIAQDIPIPFKFAMPRQQESPVQFSSELNWKFLEEHGGVIEAPLTSYEVSDGSIRKLTRKLCYDYLKQGKCPREETCTFDHKRRGVLSSLPSWCESAETSQESPAASPDRERAVSSNDSTVSEGPWTLVERPRQPSMKTSFQTSPALSLSPMKTSLPTSPAPSVSLMQEFSATSQVDNTPSTSEVDATKPRTSLQLVQVH
jgi:hypothetical protein